MPRDIEVLCGRELGLPAKGERLRFLLNGKGHAVRLRIAEVSRSLLKDLPDVIADLIEIAAYVYAADAAVSRGGKTDEGMGARWRRHFCLEVPVRALGLWQRPEVVTALVSMLEFLSDDQFLFRFVAHSRPHEVAGCFEFGLEQALRPDAVVMFSGGLDSYAGALEELIERGNKVALVSHHSSTKIAKVQSDLAAELRKRVGPGKILRMPVHAQLVKGTNREGSHRTRSFLFAVLGLAAADAHGLSRVHFYENGVVSLNLPPVAQVVGSRATRTTHPRTLRLMSALFTAVLDKEFDVVNPYFWRTKTEIVGRINTLGFGDQILHTRSCADVHNLTIAKPHCGRCSQCIDRRFAVLSAGLERLDPEEAYLLDLMTDARPTVQDREIALAYVRNARAFRSFTPAAFLARYGELARVVSDAGGDPTTTLLRLVDLHRRHGIAVTSVMDAALSAVIQEPIAATSLLAMYRSADVETGTSAPGQGDAATIAGPPQHTFRIDRHQKAVHVENLGILRGTDYLTFVTLAEAHLKAAGCGLMPEDYPAQPARVLLDRWKLADESTVRRRIQSLRRKLAALLGSEGSDLVENLAWHGYRLRPEQVQVFVEPAQDAK